MPCRYFSLFDPVITTERVVERLINFFSTHFPDFQSASVRVVNPSAIEINFTAACVFSELYPLARGMQIVGHRLVDSMCYERPCIHLTPCGVWGINNCNVFDTLDRMDHVLEHIFLTQLRLVAFISVRELVDHVLAFFTNNDICFPEFDPLAVTICTDRTFPHSDFEYAVIRVDKDTVLSVHNDWNIPLSDLSVYTIPCSIQRVRKRRRDGVLVAEIESVNNQLTAMFADCLMGNTYSI